MIQVICVVTTLPGQTENFLREFHAVSPLVRKETGCVEYYATQDVESGLERQSKFGVNVVVIVEKWRSTSDLKAHLATPHMAAYKVATKEFVESSVLHVVEACNERSSG